MIGPHACLLLGGLIQALAPLLPADVTSKSPASSLPGRMSSDRLRLRQPVRGFTYGETGLGLYPQEIARPQDGIGRLTPQHRLRGTIV